MKDIAKRLRVPIDEHDDWIIGADKTKNEGADEIDRLRAALADAYDAMVNWHLLSDDERDERTNKAGDVLGGK